MQDVDSLRRRVDTCEPIHASRLIEDKHRRDRRTCNRVRCDWDDEVLVRFSAVDSHSAGRHISRTRAFVAQPQAATRRRATRDVRDRDGCSQRRNVPNAVPAGPPTTVGPAVIERWTAPQETAEKTIARAAVSPSGTSLKFTLGVSRVTTGGKIGSVS